MDFLANVVVSHLSILGFINGDSTRCQRFGIAALIWIIAAIPMIAAQEVPAIPADSFVESIGVNTHWGDNNVYTNNYTDLKAKLGEAGIRYVRDGAYHETYVRATDLYQSLGIRTNMLTGRRSGPYPAPLDPTQIDAELDEIKTQALNATVSLEAPNEYDISHGPDTDWVGKIKNYSSLLYTKAKADETLRHLPVIAPSMTSEQAYEAVGDSDQYIDYVNLHMYQSSRWPGTNGWGDHGYGSITWSFNWLASYQSPSGKPAQSTESGYSNDITSQGISEEAEGKYTARMFAEYFRRGITRTYKYELVNEGQSGREGLFGLLRNDMSEKPVFRAVKNLIAILSDKGPDFRPGSLNYALDDSVNNVRQILFQKRDGDFYLVIWLEVPSWDVNANIDLYPPAQEVLLTLLYNHNISSAMLYSFNNSADVNTSPLNITNNQISLHVTDKISIIRLSTRNSSISHGLYRLTPKSAFQSCIDSTGEYNHAFIMQRQYSGGLNQQWIVESVGDGFYRLINRASSRVLGIDGCHENNGGTVQSYDWLDSDCQKWQFEPLSDGYYRITPKHAQDQCLGVQLCSPMDGSKVQQEPYLNTDCQHWKLDWIAPAV